MNPKLPLNHIPRWVWLSAAGLLVTTSVSLYSISAKTPDVGKSGDLLGLIHELNGTTNEMLANTQALHKQVQTVQKKLEQLNAQEAILQKQNETGQNLQRELKTQEELTAKGVFLMEEILEREKVSVSATGKVRGQVQELTKDVIQNAKTLQQTAGALQVSQQQSVLLNNQMDQLLAELDKSRDSFKWVGKLKNLLQQPTNVIDSLLGGLFK
jgi:chromosome segregation ATPase